MRADRITTIISRLKLRPRMGAAELADEIEKSAPEATLEEVAQILNGLRREALDDRNCRDRLRHEQRQSGLTRCANTEPGLTQRLNVGSPDAMPSPIDTILV